jgi:Protein of unknown function (DUF1566)/Domain of unknown function (DUF4214)
MMNRAIRCLLVPALALLAALVSLPTLAAFVDNGDGTVTDTVTGLMWDKCPYGQTANDCSGGSAFRFTWAQALVQTVALNGINYKGHNDWRLPSIRELESLVLIRLTNPAIDDIAFPNTDVTQWYWSSTLTAHDTSSAWAVPFQTGDVNGLDWTLSANKSFARVVRSGQSGDAFDLLTPTVASITANAGTTPQSATVSTAFANPLGVTVKDAGNNPVSGVNVTFTAPGSGASGVFSNSTATIVVATNASGVAATPFTANATIGSYVATATVAGVASPATFSLQNAAATVAALTVVGGAGQSTRVSTPFPTALTVKATDGGGAPVPNATVQFIVPAQAATAVLSTVSAVTDVNGLASVTATASAISGLYQVAATSGAGSASFTLTNTITIAAGNTCAANAATNADLVEQYYAAVLRRASDAGGKAFWISEADRLCALGVDPKEVFFLLANVFFNSPEYLAFNRDNMSFVTDNYVAFFGRQPDVGGLNYWIGQIVAGLPRNIVMSSFLFSPEFTATMNGVFPGRTARAETYLTLNLYGGLFRRLADSPGYLNWDGQFRTAQCNGSPTAAVRATIDAVSSQFLASPEYAARAATHSQYVQDLYYALLQRGGDLPGFNFWVTQLTGGIQSREQVRQQFLMSPEMQAQSAAIAAQGCLP